MHRALKCACLPNNQQVYGKIVKGMSRIGRMCFTERAVVCECAEERLRGSAVEPGLKDLISSYSSAAGLPAVVKGFRIRY